VQSQLNLDDDDEDDIDHEFYSDQFG